MPIMYGSLEASLSVNALNIGLLASIVSILASLKLLLRAIMLLVSGFSSTPTIKVSSMYKVGDLVEIIDNKNLSIRRMALITEQSTTRKYVFRIVYVVNGTFSEPVWMHGLDFHRSL
jgi:hypothetical protein